MSAGAGSLEFAHARIGARWGARPDAAAWRRIEITRELPAMLELARSTALSRWLAGIDAGSGVHAIEIALRRRWREAVAEVADWMAPAWRDAIEWCARLADLNAVQAWARGEPLPAGGADDAGLRDLDHDADEPPRGGGAAAAAWHRLLRAARADPASAAEEVLRAWRSLWPRAEGRDAIERTLWPLLRQHRLAFAAPDAVDGWGQRRLLESRLAQLLRRHPVEPIAAFAFLALQALELERLRAELVGRAAFPRRVLHT